MSASLPPQFGDLEAWTDWSLGTERARYDKRAASSMEVLRAFYDALKPRMEELIQHLSAFSWGTTLSEEDQRLYHLGLAYMEAAVPIDLGWKGTTAQDSYPVERIQIPERP